MINQSKSAFHRLSFAPFALLVAALTLAACESVDIEAAVQRSTPIDSEALPADVRLAAAAVAMAMKGYGPGEVQGVAFADGAATGVREAELNYDGFAVQALDVVSYQVTTGPVAGAELGGLMLLSDPMGRRAAVRFLATYEFSGPGITITHASVTPLFARRPVTQAFIVPYNPAVDLGAMAADHATLFSYASANAIDPAQTSGEGDYDVFVFLMDRASDTSTLAGRISQNSSVSDGFEGATTLLDYNGWKVAVISGVFDPSGADSLYAKTVHTPGEEMLALFRTDRLVGLYGLTAAAR